MNNFVFDEELLKELFPNEDFIFISEDGTEIEINNKIERMRQKKQNLYIWIKNQEWFQNN